MIGFSDARKKKYDFFTVFNLPAFFIIDAFSNLEIY